MDIKLAKPFQTQRSAEEAVQIIRKCVHCGFCTATCPSYQLSGDEADSPRGRIYLIKALLEKGSASAKTREYLDRCLLCRACETTCPSGVEYGRLLETGRAVLEDILPRPAGNLAKRKVIARILVMAPLMRLLFGTAKLLSPFLPKHLKKMAPTNELIPPWPEVRHKRQMLVLAGCVQSSLSPWTNSKAAQVLDDFGISLLQETEQGCCGAVGLHTGDHQRAMQHIRARIDQWWPHIEDGIEAIVFTASGCGVTIKDYAYLLKADEQYAFKATRVSSLAKDLSQIILAESDKLDPNLGKNRNIVFHAPCSMQHGLGLGGTVERILSAAGYHLLPYDDAHLCCGSAGTYSIFQPAIANQLRDNKLSALQRPKPELIATANIGCQHYLKSRSKKDVIHWIDLL